MAELVFEVKASYEQVIQCREELKRLEQQMRQLDNKTPQNIIDAMVSRYKELTNIIEQSVKSIYDGVSRMGEQVRTNTISNVLSGFDEQVKRFSGNLGGYFNDMRDKLYDMLSEVENAKESINNIIDKKGNSEEITRANNLIDEIENSIEKQIGYIENEQSAYNALATSIGTATNIRSTANNVTNAEIASSNQAVTSTQQQISAHENLAESIEKTIRATEGIIKTYQQSENTIKGNSEALSVFENLYNILTSIDDKLSRISGSVSDVGAQANQVIEDIKDSASVIDFGVSFGEETETFTDGLQREIGELESKKARWQKVLEEWADVTEHSSWRGKIKEEFDRLATEIEEKKAKLESVVNSGLKVNPNSPTGDTYKTFTVNDSQGNSIKIIAKNATDAQEEVNKLEDYLRRLRRVIQDVHEYIENNPTEKSPEIEKALGTYTALEEKLKDVKSVSDLLDKNGGEIHLGEIDSLEKSVSQIQSAVEKQKQLKVEAENTEKPYKSIRTRIQEARQEIINLIDANKQNTEEFEEAVKKASNLEEEMQQVNLAMEYGKQGGGLEALKDGLQGIAGIGSLATGVLGLFNKNSEEMIVIQTKIQSLLGIIVGLQQTYTFWTKSAAIAQRLLNAAVKASPWGWALAAITAVIGAIVTYISLTKNSESEQKRLNNALKDSAETYNTTYSNSMTNVMSKYKQLQGEYEKLKTEHEKTEWIDDNKSGFDSLGVAVNSVNDAERLFRNDTQNVIKAFTLRAQAAAYAAQMTQLYQNAMSHKAGDEIDKSTYEDMWKNWTGDKAFVDIEYGVFSDTYKLTKEGADYLNKQAMEQVGKQAEEMAEAQANLEKQSQELLGSLSTTIEHTEKEVLAKQRSTLQKQLDRLSAADAAGKKGKKIKDKIAEIDKQLKSYSTTSKSSNKGKSASEIAERKEEILNKQALQQRRETIDLELSTREAEIKAMRESSAKRLAQIQLSHDKEVEAIKRSYEDMRLKRVEEAKRLWEAEPQNKKKNFYESEEYKNALNSPLRRVLSRNDSELKAVQERERELIESIADSDIITKLQEKYGKGNVDVIARPVIDAARLAAKGWKDVGDGIATVFSMQRTVLDQNGKERQVLFTPILPDGNVLSPKEIDDYLENVLSDSDILGADSKGIVIKVGTEGDNTDLGGFDLHNLHEKLFDSDAGNQIKDWYDNLTDIAKQNLQASLQSVDIELKRSEEEYQKQEQQAWWNYLSQYGTFQQRKLALAEEYAEKIRQAQESGDVIGAATLMREQEQKASDLRLEEIKSQIDWEGVFRDLNMYSKEYLEGLRGTLSNLMKDPALKPEDAQVIGEKLGEIDNVINEKAGNTFRWVNSYLVEQKRLLSEADAAYRAYQEAMKEEIAAKEEQIQATQEVEDKQTDIATLFSQMGGDEILPSEITEGSEAKMFEELGLSLDDTSEQAMALKAAFEELKNAMGNLTGANAKVAASEQKTEKAKAKSKNADEKTEVKLKDRVAGFMKGLNEDAQKYLSDLPDLLGTLGMGKAGEKVQKGLNGINDAAGAAADFASGNYVGAALKGISAVNNFGEALGVWSSSNRAEVEAANKKLEIAMGVNTEAVNRLTSAMEKQNPEDAFKSYEQAVAALKANEEAERRRMENNTSMYDGGHSLNYDLDDAGGVIQQIFRKLNKTTSGEYSIGDLIHALSAADWNRLYEDKEGQDLLRKLGEAIAEAEDDGNYNGIFQDILKFANTYSDDVFGELANKFNTAVTQVSFDSMYSSFVSSLMDMNKKASEFSNDFESYLRTAIYEAMAVDQIKPMLQQWYKAFAAAMKSKETNGKYLSQEEINNLMREGGTYTDENGVTQTFSGFEAIKNAGLELRKAVEELGLYNGTDQTATSKSIQNITYEQGDDLVGRITAGQILWEHSLEQQTLLNAKVDQLFGGNEPIRNIAADSRDILAGMAIDLSQIKDGVMDTIVPRIRNIDSEIVKVRKAVEAQ